MCLNDSQLASGVFYNFIEYKIFMVLCSSSLITYSPMLYFTVIKKIYMFCNVPPQETSSYVMKWHKHQTITQGT